MSTSAKSAVDRLPPQTKFIVGNEACERFSYYGIRSILAGYITGEVARGGLGQSADTSTTIIHLFIFANYFMPLLGAWLSDRLIGRYYTILYVSLVYCLGNAVLACSDFFHTVDAKLVCLCAGLGLIAIGSGGIKPCVSAFMGDQFKPEQGHLLQKAYGAFYWAINFGSFFSFLVVPAVKNHSGYGWAFGVPGILMALATLIFWVGTKHYTRIQPSIESRKTGFFSVFAEAFRNQGGSRAAPLFNLVATLGLPTVAMVALTYLALHQGPARFSGPPNLEGADIRGLYALASRLAQPADPVSSHLSQRLPAPLRQALVEYLGSGADAPALQARLAEGLNPIVNGPALYEPGRFAGVILRSETRRRIAGNPQGPDLIRLNRLLVEDAYPESIRNQLVHEPTPLARSIGWAALGCVGLWYLLVVAASLLHQTALGDSFWQAARNRFSERDIAAARSLSPILFIFALVPVFWALFDQTTSTWVLQGQKMEPLRMFRSSVPDLAAEDLTDLPALATKLEAGSDELAAFLKASCSEKTRALLAKFQGTNTDPAPLQVALLADLNRILGTGSIHDAKRFAGVTLSEPARKLLDKAPTGDERARLNRLLLEDAYPHAIARRYAFAIGAEQMQSANPALVMVLVPLLTLVAYPRLGRLATPLRRMSAGMFFAAASYVVVAGLQQRLEGGAHPSVLWQTVPYLILTTGEVLLSTTGLEFAFAEAAPEMRSTIMSFWLLTVAFGNLVVSAITKLLGGGHDAASVSTTRFLLYAALTAAVGVLFSLVAVSYRYRHPTFRALIGEAPGEPGATA
jgi:dipeptide/tripeptide permease